MSYYNIDESMYSRNSSYELALQEQSSFVTREELEDAKKELNDLRKKRFERLEEIEKEKRERDERISAEELQMIMLPIDIFNKRIYELKNLIFNARVVEKSSKIQQDEIQEAMIDNYSISGRVEELPQTVSESLPDAVFFVKEGRKIEAKPGNRTPFYALVDGEYMGYNRLLLNGWILVDDSECHIEDFSRVLEISKQLSGKERANYNQYARANYPNAFAPWTENDNNRLLDLYSNQSKTLAEISEILGRTRNGVSIQLKKLLGVDRLPCRKRPADLDKYSLNPISITTINPAEISDAQMPRYLDLIEQMEEWFKYVKSYAEQQAIENGVYYEGYEIKTTYKNACVDPQKIMETIQKKFPNLFSSCVQLKSISAVKKVLGEENYESSIANLVVLKEQKTLVKSK